MRPDESVRLAFDREEERLEVFGVDRSCALRNLLAAFEVEIDDLYILDQYGSLIEAQPVPFVSGRNKLEDALCRLVPRIWARCQSQGTYNTQFDQRTFVDALAALKFQAMRNMVEQLFDDSRDGLNNCSVDRNTIKFSSIPGLDEVHQALRLRNIKLESELTSRMVNESMIALTRPGHGFLDSWVAGLNVPMAIHGFEPEMSLGAYTVNQLLLVWASLLVISNGRFNDNLSALRLSYVKKKIDPRTFILTIRRKDLEAQIVQISHLSIDAVRKILTDLTYNGSAHQTSIFLRPVIPIGADYLTLAPSFLINVDLFRNLRQRLILESRDVYHKIKDKLAQNLVDSLAAKLRDKGFDVWAEVPVKGPQNRQLTDIDLLAIREALVLVIQVKNVNPYDTWTERSRASEDLTDAQMQLSVSLAYVKENLPRIIGAFSPRRTMVSTGYDVRGIVISGFRPQIVNSARVIAMDVIQFETYLESLTSSEPEAEVGVRFEKGIGWCQVGDWRIEAEIDRPNGIGDRVLNLSQLLPLENILEYVELAH